MAIYKTKNGKNLKIILWKDSFISATLLSFGVEWFHVGVGVPAALVRFARGDHATAGACDWVHTSLLEQVLLLQLPVLVGPVEPRLGHLVRELSIALAQVTLAITIVCALGIHCIGLKIEVR